MGVGKMVKGERYSLMGMQTGMKTLDKILIIQYFR